MAAEGPLRGNGGWVDRPVLPGDVPTLLPETGEVKIGQGLHPRDGRIMVTKPGVFRKTPQGKLWVEASQKRYVPQVDDLVIGVVGEKGGDTAFVDIRGPSRATLSLLKFEGATQRNRPNLKSGDLVYARVESASRDLDPELSCVDQVQRAMGFGILKSGCLIEVSTGLARRLLSRPPAPILVELGALVRYEVAVGMNGRVWVNASSPRAAAVVMAAIRAAETLSDDEVAAFAAKLAAQMGADDAAKP